MDWLHRRAQILHIDVVQSSPLGAEAPIEHVIFMAGVASFVGGYSVVLKVSRGDIVRIVDLQASTVGLHDVAGEAERRLFGSFHLRRGADETAEYWQGEEANEGEDFPVAVRG